VASAFRADHRVVSGFSRTEGGADLRSAPPFCFSQRVRAPILEFFQGAVAAAVFQSRARLEPKRAEHFEREVDDEARTVGENPRKGNLRDFYHGGAGGLVEGCKDDTLRPILVHAREKRVRTCQRPS